jgi:hypothetical protein
LSEAKPSSFLRLVAFDEFHLPAEGGAFFISLVEPSGEIPQGGNPPVLFACPPLAWYQDKKNIIFFQDIFIYFPLR